MNEEFDRLYNKILDGVEDWDYSDLDKLIEISRKDGADRLIEQSAINGQKKYKQGSDLMREKAIKVYRNLCTSYKVQTRYECGNYSHRQEWKTKTCDMNCEYMKKFLEKI